MAAENSNILLGSGAFFLHKRPPPRPRHRRRPRGGSRTTDSTLQTRTTPLIASRPHPPLSHLGLDLGRLHMAAKKTAMRLPPRGSVGRLLPAMAGHGSDMDHGSRSRQSIIIM